MQGDQVQAVEQVLAELAAGHQLRQVAVGGRRPRARPPRGVVLEPSTSKVRSCSTRSSLTWARVQFADLVEKDGAAVGHLEAALAVLLASVNAPCTWPNISLSKQRGGDAAAFDLHQRAARLRRLLRWMASASSSLPVPLSPVISTEASVVATRPTT